ncbi:MAG: aminomethyl-transferring glycine dehydrogenase subunit GcvPB, partial [Clostridia bacterium]|nr:aminomethyl-transferring glycine dehydrogenase subunit GcvPB [Clostridia bacterium]
IKAYAYILANGAEGLDEVSTAAVANANYLCRKLSKTFTLPYGDDRCMHEFVLSGQEIKDKYGVSTLDMAKRLIEMGYHPPTIYFPLIVHEAIMIEPCETETVATLKEFVDAMLTVAKEAKECPEKLHAAPQNKPVTRLDETLAARTPVVKAQ